MYLLLTAATPGVYAQVRFPERNIRNAAEIQLALQKLSTVGSVLFIAAHPDDENTRMIAWLANDRKVRTGYLSLTRGDGGQNLIGKEQGADLGILRTQELLEARRRDGAEQFFTRALDFGYSKTPEETFRIWGKERILADVVWVIRKFRPDVIISRFPTTGEGGHGHHTASAILANEAFELAANPKAFPEQLKWVKPWKAKRVLWNTFSWNRKPGEVFPGEIAVNTGTYNALLGKSHGEIAAEARSMHRCQGFGTRLVRGDIQEFVKNILGDSIKEDIFEDIDLSWKRLPGGTSIQLLLDSIRAGFDPANPSGSIDRLLALRTHIQGVQDEHWRKLKGQELDEIILACAGLYAEATTSLAEAVPGQEIEIGMEIINRSALPVKLDRISIEHAHDSIPGLQLTENKPIMLKQKIKLSPDLPVSQPHWLVKPPSQGIYNPADETRVDQPENTPPLAAQFHLQINGQPFLVSRPVWFKEVDPSVGEIYQPLVVTPQLTFDIPRQAMVFPNGKPRKIEFSVRNAGAAASLDIRLNPSEGWKTSWSSKALTFSQPGEIIQLDVLIYPPPGKHSAGTLSFEHSANGGTGSFLRTDIHYPHIKKQTWFPQAQLQVRSFPLEEASGLIGYIAGAGDQVPAALQQMGYTVEVITDAVLEQGDLSGYKAIIGGIRLYNTNEKMGLYHKALTAYVNGGGVYIVQYNTNNFIGTVNVPIGPAPFTIGRDRVTDEQAAIKVLAPEEPVLVRPNAISPADFEGWVQERGLYFLSTWDSAYVPLFEMHDPGEAPLKGSTVVGRFGQGYFIYTTLAFFRQLPAGVPGAFRLLSNFIESKKQEAGR